MSVEQIHRWATPARARFGLAVVLLMGSCDHRAPPYDGLTVAGPADSGRDAISADAADDGSLDGGNTGADAETDDAGDDAAIDAATPAVGGCETYGCTNAVELSAGRAHTCARLTSGQVVCWGRNAEAQLGDGTTDQRARPVDVTGLMDGVRIGAGGSHSCAIRSSGHVVCWGKNADGQLGDGTTTTRSTFAEVAGLDQAIAISAGDRSTCACRATGQIFCWGYNGGGRLGDGTTVSRDVPVQVLGVEDAITVGASGGSACALRSTGQVVCWGDGYGGRLGNGSTAGSLTPVTVENLVDAVEMDVASAHSCARRASGQVICWGNNFEGELGTHMAGLRLSSTPMEVYELTDATAVAAGGGHTCAIRRSGQAVCWGAHSFHEIGSMATPYTRVDRPINVRLLPDAVEIAAGISHSCARKATGQVVCWGANTDGQGGAGRATLYSDIPLLVNPECPGAPAGFTGTCPDTP